MDAGAVPLLVLCFLEPEMALKRITASTLSNFVQHTPELACTVADNAAIAHLAQMTLNPCAKLKVGQPHFQQDGIYERCTSLDHFMEKQGLIIFKKCYCFLCKNVFKP